MKLAEKLKILRYVRFRYYVKTKNIKNISLKNSYFLEKKGDYYCFFTNDLSFINKDESNVFDNYKNIFSKIFKTNIISSLCILSILLMFLMSNFTIRELVFSNESYYNYNIYSDVNKYIKRVGPIFYLDKNVNDISNELRHKYYNFAYIGVRKVGSKLLIDIEKIKDVEENIIVQNKNCDLVSTVDGKIVGIEVEKGKTLISINQIVSKGDVLVSGNLNYNQNASIENNLVCAKGYVLIEYAYYEEVVIPKRLNTLKCDLTKNTNYEVSIFGRKIFKNTIDKDNNFIVEENIFIINKLFELKKLNIFNKSYEEFLINQNDAKDAALTKIYFEFSEQKVSEKEKIELIKLVNSKHNEDNYVFCFLIKQIKNSVECRYYE